MQKGKMQLTPPKKNVFYFSVLLALIALVLYFLGMFGVVEDTLHYAFWTTIVGWLAMTAGVAAKGV